MNQMEPMSASELQDAEEFCADLSAFCTWGECGLQMSEKAHKQAAHVVMVGTARAVLVYEMTNVDISNRYDTLQRLGLVPVGGYKQYFEEAQRLLDAEKSAA